MVGPGARESNQDASRCSWLAGVQEGEGEKCHRVASFKGVLGRGCHPSPSSGLAPATSSIWAVSSGRSCGPHPPRARHFPAHRSISGTWTASCLSESCGGGKRTSGKRQGVGDPRCLPSWIHPSRLRRGWHLVHRLPSGNIGGPSRRDLKDSFRLSGLIC